MLTIPRHLACAWEEPQLDLQVTFQKLCLFYELEVWGPLIKPVAISRFKILDTNSKHKTI